MQRTSESRRPDPAEWVPKIPRCVRCGAEHWKEWIVLADEGWVGAPCLTEVERGAWCRPESVGHGKVSAPTAGK